MNSDEAAAALRAWLNFSRHNRPGYDHLRDVSYTKAPICDAHLEALLDEREQLREDWMRQAAQLNRIAGIAGHALLLRACDDSTPEEIRVAFARACEDVQAVIAEPLGDAQQRAERFRALCAGLINDAMERERDDATDRAETAEAALETLRGQLGETRVEWAIRSDKSEVFCATEAGALGITREWNRIRTDGPWRAESRLVGEWRVAEEGGEAT